MKTNILMLIFFTFFLNCRSQNVFDKFENKEGVNAILVNKKMFQLMSNLKLDISDLETQQYMVLIKKLDDLKVFTSANSTQIYEMKSTAENYAKTNRLNELINTAETKKTLKIWTKNGTLKNQINEILMFKQENTVDNQSILMNLKGSFELDELSILMKKMNIQGADEVKTLTK